MKNHDWVKKQSRSDEILISNCRSSIQSFQSYSFIVFTMFINVHLEENEGFSGFFSVKICTAQIILIFKIVYRSVSQPVCLDTLVCLGMFLNIMPNV